MEYGVRLKISQKNNGFMNRRSKYKQVPQLAHIRLIIHIVTHTPRTDLTNLLRPSLRIHKPRSPTSSVITASGTKTHGRLLQIREYKNRLTMVTVVNLTRDRATSRRHGTSRIGRCRELRSGWQERTDLNSREKDMAWFLREE